ncbi:MAG TPA: GTPase HflX [Phycisphaerales bacterium]|nr:GTPase HflX [Phycisphaerales bacterium]
MPQPPERTSASVRSERAVLAAVRLPDSTYDPRDPFGELSALAEQAGAVVVGQLEQRMQRPVAGTYMGTGKVEELRDLVGALGADVVIFDHDLSPKQIASIEEVVGKKVIDRSELILDIFAARATTHEAKLQVELAQLEYTYPRLRAMWSHLERITGHGGVGGIGTRGPGEQQLEIDRRLVQSRRLDLKRELDQVHARKRRLVRQRRKDYFTVCLTGYTNAGKSTLFNTLTAGGAYADDRLFATLVTRTREWELGGHAQSPPGADPATGSPEDAGAGPAAPGGDDGGALKVMLSDTVGFVRDLPHHLIASFRATLEEATHADLLLVVLDVSDPAADLQFDTVTRTLDELVEEAGEQARDEGDSEWEPPRRLLLLNKADALADNREVLAWLRTDPEAIPVAGGDPAHPGIARLRAAVLGLAQGRVSEVEIVAPMSAGRTVLAIEQRGQVLERAYENGDVRFRVRIGSRQLDEVRSIAGGAITVRPVPGRD